MSKKIDKYDIFDLNIDHIEIINEFRIEIGEELSKFQTDHDCLRYLRARRGDIEKAKEMLINTEKWRHTLLKPIPPQDFRYSPNTLLSMQDNFWDNPANSWLVEAHHGYDKFGHPIYWEKTGYVQSNWGQIKDLFTVDELVQYHIASQEASRIRMAYASKLFNKDIQKCTTVFDMKYLTMSLDVGCIMYMKQILQIDQNYYPERLHQLFVINCPWYMNGLYSLFKPLLDTRTTDKFKFMGPDYLDELSTYIDLSTIPTDMGGQCKDVNWCGPYNEYSGVSPDQAKEWRDNTYHNGAINSYLTEEERLALEISLHAKPVRVPIPSRHVDSKDIVIDSANTTIDTDNTINNDTNDNNSTLTLPDEIEISKSDANQQIDNKIVNTNTNIFLFMQNSIYEELLTIIICFILWFILVFVLP